MKSGSSVAQMTHLKWDRVATYDRKKQRFSSKRPVVKIVPISPYLI